MKLVPILAVLALALPVGANAGSLAETHVLVWHPAGKTPVATYKMRGRPPCAKQVGHRAGRGQFVPAKRCSAIGDMPGAAPSAGPDRPRPRG